MKFLTNSPGRLEISLVLLFVVLGFGAMYCVTVARLESRMEKLESEFLEVEQIQNTIIETIMKRFPREDYLGE